MVLREWLLFRFVFLGDARAWRRLKALSRLRTRKELKELSALVRNLERLGIDPSPIVDVYTRAKSAQLQEAAK